MKMLHTNVHVYKLIPAYIYINGHAYKCTHLHGNVVYAYICRRISLNSHVFLHIGKKNGFEHGIYSNAFVRVRRG